MSGKSPSDVKNLTRTLLAQQDRGGGRGRRSRLYFWMFSRAEDLRPLVGHATWDSIAASLPDTPDILDGAGKRPSGDRLRKTYYAVALAKGWLGKSDPPRPEPPSHRTAPIDDDEIVLTSGAGTSRTIKVNR